MLHYNLKKRQARAADRAEKGEPEEERSPKRPARNLAKRAADVSVKGPSSALRVRESALFRPVKAIGAITDGVPLTHALIGDADFIVTSVGRGFQVFECEHLRPTYNSPRLREKIRALYCVGQVVITALKTDILAWYKLIELGRFRGHTSTATVLCSIGTQFLLSASENEALVWRLSDIGILPDEASHHKSCVVSPLGKLDLGASFGECSAVCHPPTYLHKVLVGGSSGSLALWNLRSCERVHSFTAHQADGKPASMITCLCEAPDVLDTVAVGFANGRICILNAREDRVIMEFDQAQGRVTSMAFRAGNNAPAHLVSGAPDGAFVVWDLNKRRAHHVREGVHRGPIVSLHFLFDQPVLITGGRDNSVRMWIFDTPDGLPRLLRERRGCPGPPRRMAFYGDDKDKELIVCGAAQGGGFLSKISFAFVTKGIEYAQSNIKKLPGRFTHVPPVVDIAFCYARHWDWPAVVTAHENTDAAFIWSGHVNQLAPGCLQLPPEERCVGVPATAVAVSQCGNYCVVGFENGALHRFNLQSQLHRGPFPRRPEPMEGAAKKAPLQVVRAHSGRVCGITIMVSGKVASVAAHPHDCSLKIWSLMTHEALSKIPLDGGSSGSPSCLLLRAHGALLAASLDDGNLLVVDLHGLNVVRSFACGVPATDAAFSSDARWLAASLRDGGLRIFDLPAARCVDSFAFAQPAISVCFAPSTAYLLTAHAKGNSIQTWANKFLFDPSLSAPLLSTEPAAPIFVDEPGGDAELEEEEEGGEDSGEAGDEKEGAKAKTASATEKAAATEAANPLAPEILTLSDVPPQKWLATLHLDLVKERNKAAEPPKPLPNAPFFLPTAHDGVTPRFSAPLGDADAGEGFDATDLAADLSRILKGDRRPLEGTQFQVKLRKGDHDGALALLREQTASGVHLALEELGSLAGGDAAELKSVLEFFRHHLRKGHYADELQAYLSLFLQAHGEEIAEHLELRGLCAELGTLQDNLWSALSAQCQKARCFLGILTQTQSQW
uniref:Small-subunit processome Utp21 domain-containing protein n=1 Tax=Alexandrium monilatum TaxID=311494 RepID=A0A7S4VMH2_9DINO|mmetsp:Transcript_64848/g.204916  ORF Transcript_64848/g.204916 Transcript_64848/m.204916 type:complete len:1009 (+) Transcript_64848:103-3129(+)